MAKPRCPCVTDPPDFFPSFLPQESREQVILIPQNAWEAPAQPHFLPQRPPPSSTSRLLKHQTLLWPPLSQNQRTAQAGRNLERSSGTSFRGKGSLYEIISRPAQTHLAHLQLRGLHYIPKDAVPMNVLTIKMSFLH